MINQVFGLATLIVGGIIVADVLLHPAGVNAAGSQLNKLTTTSFSALLGNVPSSGRRK